MITYNTPGTYKTEKKQATAINIVFLLFVLLGSLFILPEAQGKNHDWCDIMWEELHFSEVPPTIYSECGSRFTYNTNKIKKSLYLNSLKYVPHGIAK